jgi:rsbT co-antagonist protein RsbR
VSRIAVIEQQKQVIVDLSTPVIEVWAGVLTLPLVGMFDQERATKVTTELLEAVVTLQASLVILDVTGIENVDTNVADHFLRMARTVRLLGSDCVLSGVRPAVAQTIVSMGLDVGEIRSFPTLRAALQRTTAALTDARTKSAPSKSGRSETSSRPAAATAPEPNKINDRSGFRRMK